MKQLHPAVRALLDDIEAYRTRAGLDRTAAGIQLVRDGNFIPRLEQGRIPTLTTIERVRAMIDAGTKAVKPRRKASK